MSLATRRLTKSVNFDNSGTGGGGGGGDTVAPSAPTNLQATAVSASSIALTWSAATDNVGVTKYRVYRNANRIASPTGLSYTDGGLSASTPYNYYVTALDAAGNESAHSNTASATTNSGGGGGGGGGRFYGDPGVGKLVLGSSNDAPDMDFNDIEAAIGSTLGCARHYYQSNQVSTAGQDCATDHSKGRIPWISFKCPGTWQSVATGQHDDWLQSIAQMVDGLAPNPVWVCLHHEPRNDGQPDQWWAKMYTRAKPIWSGTVNLVMAPILAGSSFDPQMGDPDPDIWRVPEADFIAADWYNQWWVYDTSGAMDFKNPPVHEGYKKWWEGPDRYAAFFDRVASWGDCPSALAEYGVHYAWKDPGKSSQWLKNTYEYCIGRGDVVALSYFYSGKNSPRGTWRMDKFAKPDETGKTYYPYSTEASLDHAAGKTTRREEFAREMKLATSVHLSDLNLPT